MTVVGQEQQADCRLRHDQGLGQREYVRYQSTCATPRAVRHKGEHRREQTNTDHEECQRVVHR
jgi:hypothetical protein